MMEIMNGDAYSIEITLKDATGEPIRAVDLEKLEVVLGGVRKVYPDDFPYEDGVFLFPLTQEETMRMRGTVSFEVRPKFENGDVVGSILDPVKIVPAKSRAVL